MEVKSASTALQLNSAASAVENGSSGGNNRQHTRKIEAVLLEEKPEQEEESVKISISAAGKKTSFIWVIDQIAMIIREVQLERRVADYIVEFPQRAVLILVERVFQSISLNHVSQRMAHTVKDKIQHHHSRRLVADVLGIDRAVLFPYFVSQSNHERTGTGRRVVAGHI